nr:carbohydrate kinase family protein [Maliibacterium massiliense]
MPDKQAEVVCIGYAVVDIPLCPVDVRKLETETCRVEHIRPVVGGDAINESTIIARLGHKVRMVGRLGDDMMGRFILEHCQKNSIDTAYMTVDASSDTPINIALVHPDGERTFVVPQGGARQRFCLEDIDFASFDGAKLLSLASIFVHPQLGNAQLVQIFQQARRRGMMICADMVHSRFGETLSDIREALSYVDYFFPNQEEAQRLTGKTDLDAVADALLDCGVGHVVIKTGRAGCLIKDTAQRLEVPTFSKARRVDTIGAGDNFVAGFIAALLEGKDVYACGRYANAVASVSVEHIGATDGVRSRAQVEDMMRP